MTPPAPPSEHKEAAVPAPPPPSPPPPPPPRPESSSSATGLPDAAENKQAVPPPAPKERTGDPQAADPEAAGPEESEAAEDSEAVPGRGTRFWSANAWLVSLLVHLVCLVGLGLYLLPTAMRSGTQLLILDTSPNATEQLEAFEISALVEAQAQASASLMQSTAISDASAGALSASGDSPALDKTMVERAAASSEEMKLDAPLDGAPDSRKMIEEVPDGAIGDARAVVDNYEQAMGRITQEVGWMLDRSDVVLVWCFDQSESMKDDQEEIQEWVRRVYSQLGLAGSSSSALTSVVTSYGQNFLVHTPKPTSDVDEIHRAILSVPVDPSGKEMMCPAVMQSIGRFSDSVKKGKRQMALILVTDESGERATNVQMLEQTIAVAKQARCRIYVLGREAVFGYPYAHMRWRHPQTGHEHWLPIDRGPETGVVEQLQTDGFRRRYDAYPSGFAPYEQARMVRETGGIFFMLPSLETKLLRGEKRNYELEAMRGYRPDLRAREAIINDRDTSMLRAVLWKIINDLDPYREEVANIMEVRYRFSAKPPKFLEQARAEQAKARTYLVYLDRAAKALEEIRYHRDQETSPRWQANYDLIYAQILAYTARTHEYIQKLEAFIQKPREVPFEKPKFRRLSRWDIRQSQETVGGEITDSYIQRSADMLHEVVENHPGTPWAARAQWELGRGFGYEFDPVYSYYGPRSPSPKTPSRPKIPIPKL